MIATLKPDNIKLYVNTGRKTLAQVKAEFAAENPGKKIYIINGGFFNANFTPCAVLIADGQTLAYEWHAEGVGFDETGIAVYRGANENRHKNYLWGIRLIQDGVPLYPLEYPADVGGSRPRTAMGITKDGELILLCTTDNMTPEYLRDMLHFAGAYAAVMLDGGGSTRGDFAGQIIEPTDKNRVIHNYICVAVDEPSGSKEDNLMYPEPTRDISKGIKGEGVKWLQDMLNKFSYNLLKDGDFGAATDSAVRSFQGCASLAVDGVVGAITRAALKRIAGYVDGSDKLISVAASQLGRTDASEYIEAYNSRAGTTFPLNSPWCQIAVWIWQSQAGIDRPYLTASCTAAMKHYTDNGHWRSAPAPGNLVYFDWDKSGDADHVGVVAEVIGSTVYVIEGNSSGSGANAVRCKSYSVSDPRIRGYADASERAVIDAKKYFLGFTDEADALNFAASMRPHYPSVKVMEG